MTTLRAIQLPKRDNAGNSLHEEHAAFRPYLLTIASGYSRRTVKGAWYNDQGILFRDTLVEYQVACDPGTWKEIVSTAKRLFPDQASIFTATLGVAHFE